MAKEMQSSSPGHHSTVSGINFLPSFSISLSPLNLDRPFCALFLVACKSGLQEQESFWLCGPDSSQITLHVVPKINQRSGKAGFEVLGRLRFLTCSVTATRARFLGGGHVQESSMITSSFPRNVLSISERYWEGRDSTAAQDDLCDHPHYKCKNQTSSIIAILEDKNGISMLLVLGSLTWLPWPFTDNQGWSFSEESAPSALVGAAHDVPFVMWFLCRSFCQAKSSLLQTFPLLLHFKAERSALDLVDSPLENVLDVFCSRTVLWFMLIGFAVC